MNIYFYEKKRWLWYLGFCFYVGLILFLIISLVSYSGTDSSWFYVSSDGCQVTNQAGFFGAHCAALLYYFFGGAALLVVVPLICVGLIVIQERSLKTDGERLIASLFFMCIVATFLTVYGIDVAWSPYPGGLIGLIAAQKLVYYFDPLGRLVFLYISLCASCIVLFQWSFMRLIHASLLLSTTLYNMMRKYHIVSRSVHVVTVFLYNVCITLPVLCFRFVQSLIDGKVFNDTGLLHPDDDYQSEHEWITEHTSTFVFNFVRALLPARVGGRKRAIVSYVVLHAFAKNNKKITDNVQQQLDSLLTQKVLTKKTFSTITKQSPSYALPHVNIFIAEKYADEYNCVEKELQERARILQDKLERFGVHGSVVAIKRGPVVTLFEYQPDIDTKLSKIIVLEDDLAMALQAMSIRIIAPIPGRSVVGFEVANTVRHDVLFSQIINQPAYAQFSGSLPLVLGKGTVGQAVVVDLARMPHLLIAGSTGSGKSVALNAILISLLCKLNPDDLKLILIDPKRLEFAAFTDIAHLLFPIITSSHQAAPVLRWVVQEMEDRYEKMSQFGARNITDYNTRIVSQSNSFDNACKPLPFIVVVIDELADLMITAGRDIEDLITRITQMARAAGIHMIVATQRPSVDVITGLIKANFPSRISFRVASRIDSRTILDTMGADRLLGRGDMLFLDAATSQLQRVHGAYVSDQEIERVADHIRAQRKVEYLDVHQITSIHDQDGLATDDVLYKDIRLFLDKIDEISISLLQRKFRIGYNRSARIIELLESQGLIMPQDGSKTRKVIR